MIHCVSSYPGPTDSHRYSPLIPARKVNRGMIPFFPLVRFAAVLALAFPLSPFASAVQYAPPFVRNLLSLLFCLGHDFTADIIDPSAETPVPGQHSDFEAQGFFFLTRLSVESVQSLADWAWCPQSPSPSLSPHFVNASTSPDVEMFSFILILSSYLS